MSQKPAVQVTRVKSWLCVLNLVFPTRRKSGCNIVEKNQREAKITIRILLPSVNR